MSLATKVFVAFAAVIATFLIVLGFSITQMQVTYSEMRNVNQVIVPLSLALSDVQTDLKGFSLVLNEKDPLVLRRTLQVTRIGPSLPSRFKVKIDAAASLARTDVEEPALQKVSQQVDSLARDVAQFSERGEAFSKWVLEEDPDDIQARQTELLEQARRIDEQLSALRNTLKTQTDRGLKRAKSLERSALYALIISTTVALLVAILLLAAVFWNLKPLRELTEKVRKVGDGDWDAMGTETNKLDSDRGDEIQLLRKEFVAMIQSLRDRDAAIQDQHDKLIRSERMATVGQMTSVITHELRNPLSSINLNSEMLMDALSENVEAEKRTEVVALLESIIGEVDRLRDITESYLGFTRLPEPKLEHGDLVALIHQIVDFHEWEWAQNHGVMIEIAAEVETVAAEFDANQVRQALLNLLKNAVEVSASGATVEVIVEARRIGIRDSGSGIPEEAMSELFTPFFTTKTGGTGLGLPVTHQIVEDHGWSLTVDTSDRGTTFWIGLV